MLRYSSLRMLTYDEAEHQLIMICAVRYYSIKLDSYLLLRFRITAASGLTYVCYNGIKSLLKVRYGHA